MQIKSFRDLDAWRVAMEVALDVYRVTVRLPHTERFAMSSQMQRAAVSIPSNIAEGHGSMLPKCYRYHVQIALGSVAELATCCEACAFGSPPGVQSGCCLSSPGPALLILPITDSDGTDS